MATRQRGKLSANITTYTSEPGKRRSYPDGANGLMLFADHRGSRLHLVFMFEARLRGRTQQKRIGEYPTWTLENARRKAREMQVLIDQGVSPADVEAERRQEDNRRIAERVAARVTLLDVWQAYLLDKQTSTKPLSALSMRDYKRHIGDKSDRKDTGRGKPKPGALEDWQAAPISTLTPDTMRERHALLVRERGGAQANQVMRELRAVFNFALRDQRFAAATVHGNPVAVLTERNLWVDVEPKARALEQGQLRDWWAATERLDNPTVRDYLRFLLLTGARRSEALGLLWSDIDFRWHTITFRDTKTGGDRVIPLTRHVESMFVELRDRAAASERKRMARAERQGEPYSPRQRNENVFAIAEPAKGIKAVATATGVYVTSHDLRRSFASLSEWCEIPDGIVRQVMGHSSRGDVHERHYRHRPLDLIAMHTQRFEDWLLTKSGITPFAGPELDNQSPRPIPVLRVVGGEDAA